MTIGPTRPYQHAVSLGVALRPRIRKQETKAFADQWLCLRRFNSLIGYGAAGAFVSESERREPPIDVKALHAKIGQQALEEALERFGCPEIFNSDRGTEFTSAEFLNVLRWRQVQISMDGKGCWRDNVFVERLWRSVKYEEVHLHAYETVSDGRAGLTRYFAFFNHRRPHTALSRRTPASVYFEHLPELLRSSRRALPLIPAA